MNYTEVFALYDIQAPLTFEIKDTSHGEEDYRKAVFAEWPGRKIVIKITSNDFTTPERVEGWAKTIEEYIAAGYYCPRIIQNRKGSYTSEVLIDDKNCIVYAEEYSKEALIKSSLPQSLRRMRTDLQGFMLLCSANPARETL